MGWLFGQGFETVPVHKSDVSYHSSYKVVRVRLQMPSHTMMVSIKVHKQLTSHSLSLRFSFVELVSGDQCWLHCTSQVLATFCSHRGFTTHNQTSAQHNLVATAGSQTAYQVCRTVSSSCLVINNIKDDTPDVSC